MELDYLILGAGPAGLQIAYLLHKAGSRYLVLEGGESPGTFFRTFPRHRTLISSNKVYTGYEDPELNLRFDWNSLLCDDPALLFKNYSERYFPPADDMVRYLGDFARHYALNVRTGARVTAIRRDGNFRLTSASGEEFVARRLIVATGVHVPYIPDIPGIEHAEPYTSMSTDSAEFENKRVLILGKGNSAFETAQHLSEAAAIIHVASPHSIKMAWQTHYVGHLRAVNNTFLDTYQLKSQNAVLDAVVERIIPDGDGYRVTFKYAHAEGEVQDLRYDRILACTGFRFDASMFHPECRPALTINDRFPALTSAWESVNVPDLYFAGTLMQMRDFKKSQSGFIHGFRYNLRALHHMLEARYEGRPWPRTTLPLDRDALVRALIARIARTSGLWQQFGMLADVVVFDLNQGVARHYQEVPVDYVREGRLEGPDTLHLQITLEYGATHLDSDPFRLNRIPRDATDRANLSNFLHPVVRLFSGVEQLAEHHVIENLFGEWHGPEHSEPLAAFLTAHGPLATASV